MLTLNNLAGGAAGNIQPLHWNPAVLFRRARVIAGGQVIEDIDDFNRLSLRMTALKTQGDQKEIAMEGFGLFDRKYGQAAGGLFVDPEAEDADERKIYRVMIEIKLAASLTKEQFDLSQCWEFWHKRS